MAKISYRSGLENLPANLPWGEVRIAMVESITSAKCLDLRTTPGASACAGSQSGVAFSAHAELQWLKRENG